MRAPKRGLAALIASGLLAAVPAAAAELGGPSVRAMIADEATAHAIWSVRSGLNVAALQCQFSPFLATVRNYNDLLKQHSAEFAKAYKAMEAHFRRHDGAAGRRTFDVFATRMYNSFSALDAQRSFCAAAGDIGREALAIPPGRIASYAGGAVERLRVSLIAMPDPYRVVQMAYVRVPKIPDPCVDKRGHPVKRCKL